MATIITFEKIKAYLNAIADNPDDTLSIDGSPHIRFWNVPYDQFVNGSIPGGNKTQCNGLPTPIINKTNPAESSFYLILTGANGFCGMPQMPEGGPFITEITYKVKLADGTTVTGAQIQQDVLNWLTNGFPQ